MQHFYYKSSKNSLRKKGLFQKINPAQKFVFMNKLITQRSKLFWIYQKWNILVLDRSFQCSLYLLINFFIKFLLLPLLLGLWLVMMALRENMQVFLDMLQGTRLDTISIWFGAEDRFLMFELCRSSPETKLIFGRSGLTTKSVLLENILSCLLPLWSSIDQWRRIDLLLGGCGKDCCRTGLSWCRANDIFLSVTRNFEISFRRSKQASI